MGEYADMAIDDMLSYDEYLFQHPEEVEDDPYGMHWSPFTRFRYPKLKTCRYCGQEGLFWRQYEGGWRLFDLDLEKDEEILHTCKLKDRLHGSTFR